MHPHTCRPTNTVTYTNSFDLEDSQNILKDDVTMIASDDNLQVKKKFKMFYYRNLMFESSAQIKRGVCNRNNSFIFFNKVNH